MKHVVKAKEPPSFTAWKAKANDEWQPSYGDLQNPEKHELRDALLTEQAGVCCYCGQAISLSDSHIEHFRPQKTYKGLALEYDNLHVSCICEIVSLHCGHAKGGDFDESKAISPLDQNCERRFDYHLDGTIHPADRDDASAIYMRDLLKLNAKFLRNRRAEVLKCVFDNDFMMLASDDELAKLVRIYRQPDASGRSMSFGHVLARYAERLLGDVVLEGALPPQTPPAGE
jgi:uncharacterized protein (TIGR02646 family)